MKAILGLQVSLYRLVVDIMRSILNEEILPDDPLSYTPTITLSVEHRLPVASVCIVHEKLRLPFLWTAAIHHVCRFDIMKEPFQRS